MGFTTGPGDLTIMGAAVLGGEAGLVPCFSRIGSCFRISISSLYNSVWSWVKVLASDTSLWTLPGLEYGDGTPDAILLWELLRVLTLPDICGGEGTPWEYAGDGVG